MKNLFLFTGLLILSLVINPAARADEIAEIIIEIKKMRADNERT
jgi:hypothetical protein